MRQLISGEKDLGEYLVRYEAIFLYDPQYGADIDGNRGEGIWYMDAISMDFYDAETRLRLPKDQEASLYSDFEEEVIKFAQKEFEKQ